MKTLIAEDDPISRRILETMLRKLGYEVVVTHDGLAALEVLQRADAPPIAILDWMMPGLDGLEVCRRVRAEPRPEPPYIILLTARSSKEDLVVGLGSGANDYVTKPYDHTELAARLQVGRYTIGLQQALASRVKELEEAVSRIKQLQGLLPICAWCKNVRNDQNYWQRVEDYFIDHTDVRFTHGICPSCLKKTLSNLPAGERVPAETPPRGRAGEPTSAPG